MSHDEACDITNFWIGILLLGLVAFMVSRITPWLEKR